MNDSFLYPLLSRPKVRVQNESEEPIPTGGVMRVTGGTFVGKNAVVTVAKPDNTLRRRYLVNCGPTIASENDAQGWGTRLLIAGLVLYDNASGTPALDEEWGPQPNSWLLKKDYPGYLITGGTTTFGSYHGVIAEGMMQISFFGKASGSIAKDATNGTVKIWTKNFGADTLITLPNCANYTTALVDGDKVSGSWLSGGPVIAKLPC